MALASPIAAFAVALGTDGRILSQGSLSEVLAKDATLAEEVIHEQAAIELDASGDIPEAEALDDAVAIANPKSGTLIIAEELPVGRVGWPACESIILPLVLRY